jgi:hypothetical protein
VKRGADRERGMMGRGKDSLEEITSRGNKGRQIGKKGRGRVEERGEPSIAASMQIGHLDPITQYGNKPNDNRIADCIHT